MTDLILLQQYDNLRKLLLDYGLSYWEANDTLATLDSLIVVGIANELAGKMPKDQRRNLNSFIATKPTSEQLCLFLGVTKEQYNRMHLTKLKEHAEKLPLSLQNKPAS